ncbi:hypothetical protein RUM43_008773 [Polyplax serrata]|uniref:ADP-ribosylation factor-like protein 2-binding protein n=1 Tax=Polyplax serrata TaxID=468196 RepID=A0AAN8S875_POLSC
MSVTDTTESSRSNRDNVVHELNFEDADQIKEKRDKLVDLNLTVSSNSESRIKFSKSQFTFDNVVGHLEDMLIDENFHKLQTSFLEKYWQEFEDGDENKHSYMPIFKEYTNKVEDFITSYLQKRIGNFSMDEFVTELEKRKDNLDGEVFEVLLTLSDFTAFKEIFLDYRAMKEGRTIDLHQSLCVSSVPL